MLPNKELAQVQSRQGNKRSKKGGHHISHEMTCMASHVVQRSRLCGWEKNTRLLTHFIPEEFYTSPTRAGSYNYDDYI